MRHGCLLLDVAKKLVLPIWGLVLCLISDQGLSRTKVCDRAGPRSTIMACMGCGLPFTAVFTGWGLHGCLPGRIELGHNGCSFPQTCYGAQLMHLLNYFLSSSVQQFLAKNEANNALGQTRRAESCRRLYISHANKAQGTTAGGSFAPKNALLWTPL